MNLRGSSAGRVGSGSSSLGLAEGFFYSRLRFSRVIEFCFFVGGFRRFGSWWLLI